MIKEHTHSDIGSDEFSKLLFFIAGVTGMIGSILVKSIVGSEEYAAGKVIVIAMARNEAKFNRVFEEYDCSNVRFFRA